MFFIVREIRVDYKTYFIKSYRFNDSAFRTIRVYLFNIAEHFFQVRPFTIWLNTKVDYVCRGVRNFFYPYECIHFKFGFYLFVSNYHFATDFNSFIIVVFFSVRDSDVDFVVIIVHFGVLVFTHFLAYLDVVSVTFLVVLFGKSEKFHAN